MRTRNPLRILVAHLGSGNGGNPDLALLYDPHGPFGAATVRPLTRRRLALARWDVVHVYWPEWCVRRDDGPLAFASSAIGLLALLGWSRVRGARVVWSANNIRPHERDHARLLDLYIRAFVHLVDDVHATSERALRAVTDAYPVLGRAHSVIAPLGHYRDHYPPTPLSRSEAREALRLPQSASIALVIGRMRPYKNVLGLIEAHRSVAASDPGVLLLVAGECPDPSLTERIHDACRDDPTTRVDLRFIPSHDVATHLRSCDFVVVPGHTAFNSGVAVLALSLHRPVLVPRTPALQEVVERHGPRWTMAFDGEVSAAALRAAHGRWSTPGASAGPPMTSWSDVADVLLAAFRARAGGP